MLIIASKPTQLAADIVGTLGGLWRGYHAMCRCPAHQDKTPGLSIRQGHDGILVHCFAGCDSDDVLPEISRLRPGQRYHPPSPARPLRQPNVARIWNAAVPVSGTPAEAYLLHREIVAPFDDLRFHPRYPWGPKPLTRFFPALLVAAREERALRAIQRVFLEVENGGYLDKVMLGTPYGASWQGRRIADTLALAEGFETAAKFTQLNDIPCWATLRAARLDRVHIPPSVKTLIIAEDNDAEGRRARRKAWAAYRPRGPELRRTLPGQFADRAGA